MKTRMKIKEDVIKLLIELSKDFYPKQHICKLIRSNETIKEISIFTNIGKDIHRFKSAPWVFFSAISYGPYIEYFAVSPDVMFESDFTGFALSHTGDSLLPTANDLRLFGYKGDVHIIIAHPFDNQSWAAYDNNGNKIVLEVIN